MNSAEQQQRIFSEEAAAMTVLRAPSLFSARSFDLLQTIAATFGRQKHSVMQDLCCCCLSGVHSWHGEVHSSRPLSCSLRMHISPAISQIAPQLTLMWQNHPFYNINYFDVTLMASLMLNPGCSLRDCFDLLFSR